MVVGEDIAVTNSVLLPRLPMKETLTYGFTQGTNFQDSEDILVSFNRDELPWIGNIESEIVINQTLNWKDDQETDPGSYILKAKKDVRVNLAWAFQYYSNHVSGHVSFNAKVKRDGEVVESYQCGNCIPTTKNLIGVYGSDSLLPSLSSPIYKGEDHGADLRVNGYALVGSVVYESVIVHGTSYDWRNTLKTAAEYFLTEVSGKTSIELQNRDILYIEHTFMSTHSSSASVKFKTSQFVFDWMAVGENVTASAITPRMLARRLLYKITEGKIGTHVYISDYDTRIAKTYLFAAETIRDIPNAKIYTSFNEFCDWMSTVFGYVYYFGEPQPLAYPNRQGFMMRVRFPYLLQEFYSGNADNGIIYYNYTTRNFILSINGGYYRRWIGSEKYNDPATGHPRTDTRYNARAETPSKDYVFPPYSDDESYGPMEYDGSEEYITDGDMAIYFVHRSELFNSQAPVHLVENAREVKHIVDSGSIYSNVTIGYDKKDYDNVNGRDEFNFNNTYTTGCSVSDKTLSMLSKFRADCYGIEFAIQKRSQSTTDSSADKDVFFILCKEENMQLIVDNSCEIENGLSDALYNGAFSPIACVKANEGYIGLQADNMLLRFASSTGNSDIVIDGVPMTSDLELTAPLAMAGTVEFSTDDIDLKNENDIIKVVDADGITYTGFVKEADFKYAKEETAKYKLIAKNIEL